MSRSTETVRVAIVGGAGYGGGELLRIMLGHPKVRIERVTSRRHAGEPVWGVHPNLRNVTSLPFSDEPIDELAEDCDVLFFAAPHGVAMQEFPRIRNAKVVVYDLSGDFRLRDASIFKHYYQMDHAAPDMLGDFV